MAKTGTARYDELYKNYATAQDKAAKQQTKQAQESAKTQLREAYVSKMQSQKNLNNALQQQGVRGGATESSNIALNTNYQNNRSDIYKNRDATISNINQNAEANKLNFKLQNDAAKLAYIENLEAEKRETLRQKQAEEQQALVKSYEAKYSKYYSIDTLQKALKNAKTTEEKAIINARIGYLRSAKKGY